MRMRAFIGALIEIGAPGLAREVSEISKVMLKNPERDTELQEPNRWFAYFRIDFSGKRSGYLNGLSDGGRQARELLEAARNAFRIDDMRAEQRSAAVEFKIEVTAIPLRLDKELNATVFPNRIEVFGSFAKDETILDEE